MGGVLADVVDELRLVIAPTIVGSGQRLLDGLPSIRLETIGATASPSGHLLVGYHVAREFVSEHVAQSSKPITAEDDTSHGLSPT